MEFMLPNVYAKVNLSQKVRTRFITVYIAYIHNNYLNFTMKKKACGTIAENWRPSRKAYSDFFCAYI